MNKPALRMASTARATPGAPNATESERKKFTRFIPRNPLKRLDSDERIQGNPTLIIGGFRNGTAMRQENPNWQAGPRSPARCQAR